MKNIGNDKIHSLSAAGETLASFLYVLPNKQTQTDYLIRLGYFFDYLQVTGSTIEDRAIKFLEKAQPNHKYAKDCLTGFVSYLKDDSARRLTGATIKNYFAAVKLFYEANAINLNWKWIAKGLPPSSHVANDRAPTLEELRKLAEFPDRRIKVIVYVMASSGIRVGAWQYLKYKHITPLKNDKTGQVVAAKIKVYDGLPDPYFTFCTPEALQAIEEYMAFRASYGEKISGESWLLRDKFPTITDKTGASRSMATHPIKLSLTTIKRTLGRALQVQNIGSILCKTMKDVMSSRLRTVFVSISKVMQNVSCVR